MWTYKIIGKVETGSIRFVQHTYPVGRLMNEGMGKDSYSLQLEAEGKSCTDLVRLVMSNVGIGDDIIGVSLKLESTSPFDIQTDSINAISENPATSQSDEESKSVDESETTDEGSVSEVVDEPEPDESEIEDEGITRFNEDSRAYEVAKVLYQRSDEGFLKLQQVQQFVPIETGVDEASISQVLWDLADRGLVEKKNDPDDGRKKTYKITGKGKRSVEKMKENGE